MEYSQNDAVDKYANTNQRVLPSLKNQNNCSMLNQNFDINNLSRLNDDDCHNTGRTMQSDGVNDYMLSNFADCECNINNVLKVSTDNTGLTVKDGYGVSDCNIDSDSKLRIGNVQRHYKVDLQLFPRPFMTTPYISKGEFKPDLESKMISSLQTYKHKQMQNVTEQNVYTPMTSSLAKTIQDPIHIIQENNSRKWLRGGIPSRQNVVDQDYFSRSNDNNAIKNILMSKKQYL